VTLRENDKPGHQRPWWFVVLGGAILVIYGFIPTLQPTSNFGRVYATSAGSFIMMSFLFGWIVDGNPPDIVDIVGGCVCLAGAALIYFWPRTE
jgi:small multidrug resistance family-3 protein